MTEWLESEDTSPQCPRSVQCRRRCLRDFGGNDSGLAHESIVFPIVMVILDIYGNGILAVLVLITCISESLI